ncbi:MAG: hypothetical protein ACPGN3_01250 [Opitutales bacterium]
MNLYPPSDLEFISSIWVYKDVDPVDAANGDWPSQRYQQVSTESEKAGLGEPYSVGISVLNFEPGIYYFVTFAPTREKVYTHVEITGPNISFNDTRSGLYSLGGDFISQFDGAGPLPILVPDSIYILALNPLEFKQFNNDIDFYTYDPETGSNESKISFISIVQGQPWFVLLSHNGQCGARTLEPSAYQDELAYAFFRTPADTSLYGLNRGFSFTLNAALESDNDCTLAKRLLITATDPSPDAPTYYIPPESGSLEITPDTVESGSIISIHLNPPSDERFSTMKVYRDLDPADAAASIWSKEHFVGSVSTVSEQEGLPLGTPLEIEVDLLNYPPGEYFFMLKAQGPDRDYVYDSVTVTPAPTIELSDTLSGLYSLDGSHLASFGQGISQTTLLPGEVYITALNIEDYKQFENTIYVDYIHPTNPGADKESMMKIKVIRSEPWSQPGLPVYLSRNGQCGATTIDPSEYQNGMAYTLFRAPYHLKYYETDGTFNFRLNATLEGSVSCDIDEFALETNWDDATAAPPIETFNAYNAREFPNQSWRNDYVFDNIKVRVVRIGDTSLTNISELEDAQMLLSEEFIKATKGYFQLEYVAPPAIFSLVNQNVNTAKVKAWYASVPKTPGKEILDTDTADGLYLATLLYYYENETEFAEDILKIYPPQSSGEENTLYWIDGPGSLGQAMGALGSRTKVTRLYPSIIFYEDHDCDTPATTLNTEESCSCFSHEIEETQDTEPVCDDRTYHFDPSMSSFLNISDPSEYIDYLTTGSAAYSLNNVINTTIHEMGHTGWLSKTGVNTGDQSTKYLPFAEDSVQQDDSLGHFTRFEYMSYGRNRESFENMSYGDAFLEKLLAPYDAYKIDSDADGLPNDWEWTHSGHPLNMAPNSDSDRDGKSDYEEYLADTDPSNGQSKLQIGAIMESEANAFEILIPNTSLERKYTLLRADRLGPNTPWQAVDGQGPVRGNTGDLIFSDTSSDKAFYKVEVSLP